MIILINPMMDYANDPNIEVRGLKYNRQDHWIYTKGKDGIYWYQDKVSGITDYFFHNGQLQQISDGHWKTVNNHGGYGSHVFKIQVKDYGLVEVGGPWSGGSHCANKHLPFPAIEVGYYEELKYRFGNSCGMAGHMMISRINNLLELQKSGWRAIETMGPHEHNLKEKGDHYWVTCAWNGKTKKKFQSPIGQELTKEELRQLQIGYCRELEFPFQENVW